MVRICSLNEVLWKKWWDYGRSRLFNADYLENIGASVNYPLFLNIPEQLTKAEVKKAITSVRVYYVSKTTY